MSRSKQPYVPKPGSLPSEVLALIKKKGPTPFALIRLGLGRPDKKDRPLTVALGDLVRKGALTRVDQDGKPVSGYTSGGLYTTTTSSVFGDIKKKSALASSKPSKPKPPARKQRRGKKLASQGYAPQLSKPDDIEAGLDRLEARMLRIASVIGYGRAIAALRSAIDEVFTTLG
jgi:hypothetical protein